MKIGIVGGGVVGRATAHVFKEFHEVRITDRVPERSTHRFIETAEWANIMFLCIPEQGLEDQFRMMLGAGDYDCQKINWVIRSTCPIGTTTHLIQTYKLKNVVHCPEFLTERCALVDACTPSRIIIGSPLEAMQGGWFHSGLATYLDTALFRPRFPGIPIYHMKPEESEATKLMVNAFFATKVSFFNEMYCLAKKLGLNWDLVRKSILADGRIAHSHTSVPGPDGSFGFGGKCLPKDLRHLMAEFIDAGLTSNILTAVDERNRTDRDKA